MNFITLLLEKCPKLAVALFIGYCIMTSSIGQALEARIASTIQPTQSIQAQAFVNRYIQDESKKLLQRGTYEGAQAVTVLELIEALETNDYNQERALLTIKYRNYLTKRLGE